jgi:SAM-dependent methyltransferase
LPYSELYRDTELEEDVSTSPSLAKRSLDRLSTYRRGGRSANGVPLPPLRLRAGGAYFKSDGAFIDGGRCDARRLALYAGLDTGSRVLDIGCGAGRLAIGICEEIGEVAHYLGLDVDRNVIDWDHRHLHRHDHRLQFRHMDVANERYNQGGRQPAATSVLPVEDDSFDVVYAYSVFSHMRAAEVAHYLQEIRRVLADTGMGMFTAFVETDVPDEEVNPAGYGPQAWRGALHCVRFSRAYFENTIEAAGLAVDTFEHGQETDGQSLYILHPSATR